MKLSDARPSDIITLHPRTIVAIRQSPTVKQIRSLECLTEGSDVWIRERDIASIQRTVIEWTVGMKGVFSNLAPFCAGEIFVLRALHGTHAWIEITNGYRTITRSMLDDYATLHNDVPASVLQTSTDSGEAV